MTTIPQNRFSNPKYIDWVKVKLSLQYAKEGLEPITDQKVQTFHHNLSSTLQAPSSSSASAAPVLCHACLKADLKKQWFRKRFTCLGGICDRWLTLLQQNHVDPTTTVEWDNFDVSLLPTSPWEVAKVYLPYGSGTVQCAGDTDLAAIMTLYLNCRHFASSVHDISLCEKVKDVRNNLLHSGSMEVDRAQMLSYVGLLKQLLHDPAFAADTACQAAVTKIDELVKNKLELSLNKELELKALNSDIKSVVVKTDQLRQDMTDLSSQVQLQYGELRADVDDVTSEVVTMRDQLRTDWSSLKSQLRTDVSGVTTDVSNLREKLETHISGADKEMTSMKGNMKNIVEDRTDRPSPDILDLAALQQYLIAVYEDECNWENPVTADEDKPATVSQMYVKPVIQLVRQRDQTTALVEVQHSQSETQSMHLSYKQVFYTNTEQCKNIYITGNAGMGKTTFCKQMVQTWCKALRNIADEGHSAEDIDVLKEFSLLFYLNLREVESHYHIIDMIKENILHNAKMEYNVSEILETEKCLVVLDGLDEWSCPQGAKICRGLNKEIPGRNTMHKNCVYLTTTRNWKLDVIDLKSKDCDKHVELCGIGEISSKELAKKTLCRLDPGTQHKLPIQDFFKEVRDTNLTSLTKVPVLLIQLITLWYFSKGLCKSQVHLYCKMLDLLLEQAKKHLPEKTPTATNPVQTESRLPTCFSEEEGNCHMHTHLLQCLSKLAFTSLLNKKKEDALVFKSSILEFCGIDSSDISLCLKCGIFTQSKVLGKPMGRYKKYSFLHKKIQEFLAAVHLVTNHNVENNMRQVKEYCDKLGTTLDMGQMCMFVCGMNAEIGRLLLEHLASVVSDNESVQNYRQSNVWERLIKEINTCVMACVTESGSNGLTADVHIQDYYIDKDTISDYINHVVVKKITSIKSVLISTYMCSKEHVTAVLKHLQTVQTLEKLELWDWEHVVSDNSIVAPVIASNVRTLRSLCLRHIDLLHDETLFASVLGCLPSLRALKLVLTLLMAEPEERVSHDRIEQLMAHTTHLTHVYLYLRCNDHGGQCRPVLDLSDHSQLQTLELWFMGVTNLHAVVQRVEKVVMWDATVAYTTLRQFIEALEQSSNKVDVRLFRVTVTEDSGDAADLAAYIRGCAKFTVERCDIKPDKTWAWVEFHKK